METIIKNQPAQKFQQWTLDKLVDYIVESHHDYVNESIPILLDYTAETARIHGDVHPELFDIRDFFILLAEELQIHMQEEENILFPFIKKMVQENSMNAAIIRHSVGATEHDHRSITRLMQRINELSSSYALPDDACPSYVLTFSKLKEFEEDLHQHLQLENKVLFPLMYQSNL